MRPSGGVLSISHLPPLSGAYTRSQTHCKAIACSQDSALTAQRYRIRRRIFDTLLKRRIYHRFGASQFSGMILICILGERVPPRSSGVDLRTDERSPSRETGFRPACLPVGRSKGPGKSKLDKHRPEIEALLANGSPQKFIAKRYNSSPANLANWLKKRRIKKPKL